MENQFDIKGQETIQNPHVSIPQLDKAQSSEPTTVSFLKQKITKILILFVFPALVVYFLTIPTVKLVSRLFLFQQFAFFPGIAESLAMIPSFILISIFILSTIKITLREWKYVRIGTLVIVLTIITMNLVANYTTRKFFTDVSKELDQAIEIAKKTQIQITNFEEIPTYDSANNLVKISFKIGFVSNTTAAMNIFPNVRFVGEHIKGGDNFLFDIDPSDVMFDNKSVPQGTNGYKTSYRVVQVDAGKSHEVTYVFEDFNGILQWVTSKPGHFRVSTGYSVHINDPMRYGQGNATFIDNVVGRYLVNDESNLGGRSYMNSSMDYRLKNQ